MERESFEDLETADYLNRNFVAVKVDREERPDIDQVFMDALHALGEQGGWPLNMFATPDGRPFTGGTYFPPKPMYGRQSFRQILESLRYYWQEEKAKIHETADQVTAYLRRAPAPQPLDEPLPQWNCVEETVQAYRQAFDGEDGGHDVSLLAHGRARGAVRVCSRRAIAPKHQLASMGPHAWTCLKRKRE